jgi:hypothetical protein
MFFLTYQVDVLVKREAAMIARLRRIKAAVSEEQRHCAIAPKHRAELQSQRESDIPAWLNHPLLTQPQQEKGVTSLALTNERIGNHTAKAVTKADAATSTITLRSKTNNTTKSTNDNDDDEGVDYLKVTDHPFVQQGLKFGPDIQQFVMKMPGNFPSRAGQAAHALRHQLALYIAVRKKMEKEKIPKNYADAVEKPLWKRFKK